MAEKPFSQFPRITVPKASDLLGISRDTGGGYVSEHIELDQLGVQLGYIYLREETTGSAGSSVAGWQDRILNTEVADTGDDCVLSGNQFTLQPGTYECMASAPCYGSDNHTIQLYNVTDGLTLLYGTTSFAQSATAPSQTRSFVTGRFTITEAKTFKIRHWTLNARAGNGLGTASGSDPTGKQIYTEVVLRKTASQTIGEDPRGSMVYLGEFAVNANLITCQGILDSSYKKFEIELVELDSSTENYGVTANLMNGGTPIVSANYRWVGARVSSGGVGAYGLSGQTSWNLNLQAGYSSTAPNHRILMSLESRSGGRNVRVRWVSSAYVTVDLEDHRGSGMLDLASAVYDGIQFQGISGTLSSGKARVWGIKG